MTKSLARTLRKKWRSIERTGWFHTFTQKPHHGNWLKSESHHYEMTKLARPLCPLNCWSNNASSRIRSSINSRLGKRCLGVMPISWIYCREQRDLAGTETLPGQPLKKRTRVRSTSWEAGCGRRRETSYKAADRLIPMLHWFFGESYLTRSLAGSLHNFEDQLKG